jgi:hypothetical protein
MWTQIWTQLPRPVKLTPEFVGNSASSARPEPGTSGFNFRVLYQALIRPKVRTLQEI